VDACPLDLVMTIIEILVGVSRMMWGDIVGFPCALGD
jgi:hypothetical protein